jgi:hypothetical protein
MKMMKCIAVLTAFFLMLSALPAQEGGEQGTAKGEPDFINSHIDVEATSVGAKRFERGSEVAYVNAVEAARVLAQARCAELLAGTQVEGIAMLKDMGYEFSNRVESQLRRTHVPGGKMLSKTELEEFRTTNMVTVVMRFPLRDAMGPVMRTLAPALREAEAKVPHAATPVPAPGTVFARLEGADGVIVQVPDGFKPTIAPKIYNAKGELVYGATSVAPDVLVTQGVAQFTNNTGKAKATLESRGAKGVLVVNGVLKGDTDVQLSQEDAAKLLGANAKSNFLQKGQVVIVIGGKV